MARLSSYRRDHPLSTDYSHVPDNLCRPDPHAAGKKPPGQVFDSQGGQSRVRGAVCDFYHPTADSLRISDIRGKNGYVRSIYIFIGDRYNISFGVR